MKTAWRKGQVVYCVFKRLFDIIISLIGLVFTIPIFIIFAPIIKLHDGGPVLFKQVRTGKKGREFVLYKFRSMEIDNDVRDFSKEDQMTGVGKFLRKTSLDELPQFWNVLKGEMSLVGPRPWIPEYYKEMKPSQRKRYVVRPGITGLAQVRGRNNIPVSKKIKYDLEYVDKLSFHEDFKILLLTVRAVFQKEAAYSKKENVKEELNELRRS